LPPLSSLSIGYRHARGIPHHSPPDSHTRSRRDAKALPVYLHAPGPLPPRRIRDSLQASTLFQLPHIPGAVFERP